MSFDRALPLILKLEGGKADDPDDRGGRTAYGITQGTYDAWRRLQRLPTADVWEITPEEIHAIYATEYWQAASCDRLEWPAAIVVFDAAVNHGVHQAKLFLQRALDVPDDGKVGPVTLAAMAGADPARLASKVLWLRLGLYFDLSAKPGQLKFLRGWLRRLIHVREAAGLP